MRQEEKENLKLSESFKEKSLVNFFFKLDKALNLFNNICLREKGSLQVIFTNNYIS